MTMLPWKILIFKAGGRAGSGAAGHSPNHAALATRKTCQNHEFADSFAPLTSLEASHISPQRSSGYRAILLALLAVEPWIAEFPLIWPTLPDRGGRCGASR
jgi:hypothetical protein